MLTQDKMIYNNIVKNYKKLDITINKILIYYHDINCILQVKIMKNLINTGYKLPS